jgi:hypothetical protein
MILKDFPYPLWKILQDHERRGWLIVTQQRPSAGSNCAWAGMPSWSRTPRSRCRFIVHTRLAWQEIRSWKGQLARYSSHSGPRLGSHPQPDTQARRAVRPPHVRPVAGRREGRCGAAQRSQRSWVAPPRPALASEPRSHAFQSSGLRHMGSVPRAGGTGQLFLRGARVNVRCSEPLSSTELVLRSALLWYRALSPAGS